MKSRLFWLVLVCIASSPVWAIECGGTLGPGGVYTLTADLDCCAEEESTITIRDRALLDLQGFSLTSVVRMDGTGATVRRGFLPHGRTSGRSISVGGHGEHRLEDLSIGYIGSGDGVVVGSNGNVLTRVTASADTGVYLGGDHNVVRDSLFSFGYYGISIRGQYNRVVRSRAETIDRGYFVEGNHNLLVGNHAAGAGGGMGVVGFEVQGLGNLLIRNTSTTAELDALDTHGTCDVNRWVHNDFATADPPCILDGPPAVSQR